MDQTRHSLMMGSHKLQMALNSWITLLNLTFILISATHYTCFMTVCSTFYSYKQNPHRNPDVYVNSSKLLKTTTPNKIWQKVVPICRNTIVHHCNRSHCATVTHTNNTSHAVVAGINIYIWRKSSGFSPKQSSSWYNCFVHFVHFKTHHFQHMDAGLKMLCTVYPWRRYAVL